MTYHPPTDLSSTIRLIISVSRRDYTNSCSTNPTPAIYLLFRSVHPSYKQTHKQTKTQTKTIEIDIDIDITPESARFTLNRNWIWNWMDIDRNVSLSSPQSAPGDLYLVDEWSVD